MMELEKDKGENLDELMMYKDAMEKCKVAESLAGISHNDTNPVNPVRC